MKVLLMFSLLFQFGIIAAQNIEISVLNKKSQPISYAYILINGVVVEITDTLGKAKIPIQKLIENDTISLSYLGAAPTEIIYDQSLIKRQKHCFVLDESEYILDEVVVTYKDIEKLFKRNCDYVPQLNYNCILNSNFDAIINLRNQPGNKISGQIEAVNEVFSNDFRPYQFGWFHRPIKFKTENDTINIRRLLNFHTHLALDMINRFMGIVQYQLSNNPRFKPVFNYLGEKDGMKVFRLSYRNTSEGCAQIIIYINKKTKTIKSAEIDFVNPNTGNSINSNSYNIKFDCKVFTNKKPIRSPIYLPENIKYVFKYGNYLQADLSISDISVKYLRSK